MRGHGKQEIQTTRGFMYTEENREEGGHGEYGRHRHGGQQTQGRNLQLDEEISGYFVERTRVYSGL